MVALWISWIMAAFAIAWVVKVQFDVSDETVTRKKEDAATICVIKTLLNEFIYNNIQIHLPGFEKRAAFYRTIYQQLPKGRCA
jgi:hypothetical protein